MVPALPGFGFSGKPAAPIGPRTTARLFHRLMYDVLGYRRYRVQGGDWGAGVAAWLALDFPDSVEAIHLNYLLAHPDVGPATGQERAYKTGLDDARRRLGAYSHLQETKPLSLTYAMADQPVAQLAWLVERFHDWSDLRERPFEEVFSADQLITNAILYIMTGAFDTSAWYYAGAEEENARRLPRGRQVTVPTAFSAYPDPFLASPPRSWVERGYTISRWSEMPRGGHFAVER